MFELLIVDNEKFVVENLALTYPWPDLRIGTVHKAYSAKEALAIIQARTIHVVISDIRMPGMDGLELIDKIRELSPRTKCLLLSGYSDFQYAQRAVSSQVESYLLKPVKEEELLGTVRGIIEQIESEWQAVVSSQRTLYTLNEHLPLLRGTLLNELLHGSSVSLPVLRKKLETYRLSVAPMQRFAMLLVRLEGGFSGYDDHSRSLLEFAIANISEEVFGPHFALWQGKDMHGNLVFVITEREAAAGPGGRNEELSGSSTSAASIGLGGTSASPGGASAGLSGVSASPGGASAGLSAASASPGGVSAGLSGVSASPGGVDAGLSGMSATPGGVDAEPGGAEGQRIRTMLEKYTLQVQENVAAYLKAGITALISDWGVFPTDIYTLYQKSVALLRSHPECADGFFINGISAVPTEELQPLRSVQEPPLLMHLLEAGRWEAAEYKLGEIIEEVRGKQSHVAEYHKVVALLISFSTASMIHKQGQTLSEFSAAVLEDPSHKIYRSLDSLHEWGLSAIRAIRDSAVKDAKGSPRAIIQRITQFVQEHLEHDVSLQTIADHVYLHPAYISKIYKLETGEGLSDYIYRLRMEKAAHLLSQTNARVQDIGRMIGYQNPSHFSRVFRKYYELSPEDYRENTSVRP
ncbi:response regulator [Paenibacillus daejeonensis]|uniref:response regulator n=1 Tax=Paenibacillus daejeonensis TaxID=135193 RepID=UPI00036CEEF8|nr:response regulator [Paenibacillus daejeonensis]